MSWMTIVPILVAIAVVLWLLTGGLWWVLRLVGRKTGLDEKVDHAFEAEGGLETSDYLKFREQHPHGGH